MQIPELLKKLEDAGVSPLVVVVCSIAAVVFYFTSIRPSLAEYEKWDRPGMMCSNESIGPRGGRKDRVDPRFPVNPESEFFGGHLNPMDDISRSSKLPDTDPFLDSPKYIHFFSGSYISVNKDSRGFYIDTGSRVLTQQNRAYGSSVPIDEYSQNLNFVEKLSLAYHPNLIGKEIPKDAKLYFDFYKPDVSLVWDGDEKAVFNCFNAES